MLKKGKRGFVFLSRHHIKVKEELEKLDLETNEIMLDKEGKPIMEEVEVTIPAFRAVSVFDVSQTDGRELPELTVSELSADVDGYQDFMKALEMVSPVLIGYEDILGEVKLERFESFTDALEQFKAYHWNECSQRYRN